MAITLGSITLPPTLFWEDELAWSPFVSSQGTGLTGAAIVQFGTRTSGRPITLVGRSDGSSHTGGMLRSDLLALQAALNISVAAMTLTLHDSRTFSVMGVYDENNGPIEADPLPVFGSLPPANPADTRWYLLRKLRLITI